MTSGPAKNKGLKTTLTGIIVSAVLAIVKALGGIFGHSYALVADAIESASDVLTSTMLWFGLKWSAKPPDENHPYGHGKAEAMIALGISLVLAVAAGIIVRDSILHIIEPHKVPEPYTLVILAVVILTKELLFRFVLKTGSEINSGAVKADAFHHRSDVITSAAAFIGISIALIGGKGYEVADDWAALFAAGIIFFNSYKIARPAIGELLDEELEPDFLQKVREISGGIEEVVQVQKVASRKMGVGYHVDLHIWVKGSLTVEKGHQIAHEVKNLLMERIPQIIDVHIHVEPDKTRANAFTNLQDLPH